MARRGIDELHSLKAVSNNAGAGKDGLAVLVESGQINDLIISFLGSNKALEKKYLTGEISIELCPQGSIAERLRAGGAGIPAFYTPTGVSKWTAFCCFPSVEMTPLTSWTCGNERKRASASTRRTKSPAVSDLYQVLTCRIWFY